MPNNSASIAIATTERDQEAIDYGRRKLLTGAAMGLAVVGAATLFPIRPAPAATEIGRAHV